MCGTTGASRKTLRQRVGALFSSVRLTDILWPRYHSACLRVRRPRERESAHNQRAPASDHPHPNNASSTRPSMVRAARVAPIAVNIPSPFRALLPSRAARRSFARARGGRTRTERPATRTATPATSAPECDPSDRDCAATHAATPMSVHFHDSDGHRFEPMPAERVLCLSSETPDQRGRREGVERCADSEARQRETSRRRSHRDCRCTREDVPDDRQNRKADGHPKIMLPGGVGFWKPLGSCIGGPPFQSEADPKKREHRPRRPGFPALRHEPYQ